MRIYRVPSFWSYSRFFWRASGPNLNYMRQNENDDAHPLEPRALAVLAPVVAPIANYRQFLTQSFSSIFNIHPTGYS